MDVYRIRGKKCVRSSRELDDETTTVTYLVDAVVTTNNNKNNSNDLTMAWVPEEELKRRPAAKPLLQAFEQSCGTTHMTTTTTTANTKPDAVVISDFIRQQNIQGGEYGPVITGMCVDPDNYQKMCVVVEGGEVLIPLEDMKTAYPDTLLAFLLQHVTTRTEQEM
eukprot:PhF_6_TR44461/c0_g1_i1/m.68442